MQHLDEGTIHSWLDGALTAAEAAQVEGHVNECAQCQAAVAEARGFIAASSRILTALDNAPRGVIPMGSTRRGRMSAWASRFRPADAKVWRVAASVLVVAGGTLLVVRNNGVERPAVLSETARIPAGDEQAKSDAVQSTTTTVDRAIASQQERSDQEPAARKSAASGIIGGRERSPTRREAAEAPGKAAPVAAPPAAAASVLSSQPFEAKSRGSTSGIAENRVAAKSVDAALPGIRAVEVRHPLGQRITLYEVARGDTVQLAEPLAGLEQVVTTGIAVTQAAAGGLARSDKSRAAAAKPAAPEAGAAAAAASAPAPIPATQAVFTTLPNGIGTLAWTDSRTGGVIKLSGRHSRMELEEIRRSIERLRDAAAADAVRK